MSYDPSRERVVVVGAGHSGLAAAVLLLERGVRELTVCDARPLSSWSPEAQALEARGVTLWAGSNDRELRGFDRIIVSPGVPQLPAILAAIEASVPVWGEVELATRLLRHPAPIVAIGGTNGKSTVTTLIGEMLTRHVTGAVFVGGNLGEPLAKHTEQRFSAIVLEVSSFQMERVEGFRPAVAALLNLSDDHLDRYPSFAAYVEAKGNMFVQQQSADWAVVPHGEPSALRQAQRGQGRVLSFGPHAEATVRVEADAIVDTRDGHRYPRAAIALRGEHNAVNVAAAIACARPLGATPEVIAAVLAEFSGLPHRMAKVRELDGVHYYDDSKGTNVGAVVSALSGLPEPRCVLIAGGRDKDGSYAPLVAALRSKGRAVVLIGEAAERIEAAIGDVVPTRRAASLPEAVQLARQLAQPGDAVLLSPACSSFDMFRDYHERGVVFAEAVRAL